MARLRPTELRAVAEVLDRFSGAGMSAEEVAPFIIEAIDNLRVDRDTWVLVAQEKDGPLLLWGPYRTEHQARMDGNRLVAPTPGGEYAWAPRRLYKLRTGDDD